MSDSSSSPQLEASSEETGWSARTKRLVALGGIAAVLVGLALPKISGSDPSGGGGSSDAPTPVDATVLRTGTVTERIRTTGTLRADESVELTSEAPGKIIDTRFEEGARVQAGELVVQINDAEPPSVSESDASAPPIVFLNIKSDTRGLMELTEIADKHSKERLQTIEGVSRVDIWGDKTYSMRLQLDPQKLAAYNLTPLDVRRALNRSNVELPSGRIEGKNIELTVRTKSRLETVEEFDSLLLKQSESGQTVRLEDVGTAEIAPLTQRTLL